MSVYIDLFNQNAFAKWYGVKTTFTRPIDSPIQAARFDF